MHQREAAATYRRRLAALHESCHVVVKLAIGAPVAEVSIDAGGGGEFRGRISDAPPRSEAEEAAAFKNLAAGLKRDRETREWAVPKLAVTLGPLAFELAHGFSDAWERCDSDVQSARLMAGVVADGLAEQSALVSRALDAARGALIPHFQDVYALADELQRRVKMSGDEVRAFFGRRGSSLVVSPPLTTRAAVMSGAEVRARAATAEYKPTATQLGISSRGRYVGEIRLEGGKWVAYDRRVTRSAARRIIGMHRALFDSLRMLRQRGICAPGGRQSLGPGVRLITGISI
jgi:hypothetical protein